MKTFRVLFFIPIIIGGCSSSSSTSTVRQSANEIWTISDTQNGKANSVATDGNGNVYIAGEIADSNDANISTAFVAKYDANRNQVWRKTFASGAKDSAKEIAVDARGNSFVLGESTGSMPGATETVPLSNARNFFLFKLNADGEMVFIHQFGGTNFYHYASGIALDSEGNILTAINLTHHAYIIKWPSDGSLTGWSTASDIHYLNTAKGISVDSEDNVYLYGTTTSAVSFADPNSSDLQENKIFIFKYTKDKTLVWSKTYEQLNTNIDVRGLQVDTEGNVYLSYAVYGDWVDPSMDGAQIAKFSSDSTFLWKKKIGEYSGYASGARGLVIGASGAIYAAADTYQSVDGENAGGLDALVIKISSDGNVLSTKQAGTENEDVARGLFADANENIFVGGYSGVLDADGSLISTASNFISRLSF